MKPQLQFLLNMKKHLNLIFNNVIKKKYEFDDALTEFYTKWNKAIH